MNLLCKTNIEAHKERPLTPESKKVTLWKTTNDILHCCIASSGCRFSKEYGACIMCDYGAGRNLMPDELSNTLEKMLLPYVGHINTILIGTYGSILDESEVSKECFDVILRFLSKNRVETVIFETHYSTVNNEKLKLINEKLASHTRIIIEMGYESCDEYVLKYCLNKQISLAQLQNTIDLIHKYSMKVCLNVILGAPFLCPSDQLNSALKSIKWAFERKADSVVIFPMNIKPFTLLYRLYQKGLATSISQWMLVDLLASMPQEYLGKISLSWYGNRKNFYEKDKYPLIPPIDCEKCHDRLMAGYSSFLKEVNLKEKIQIICEMADTQLMCECRDKHRRQLEIKQDRLTPSQIHEILRKL